MEIWKDMFYEGIYMNRKVSNYGNVKLDTGVMLKLLDNGAGYLSASVCSWKDSEGKWRAKREYIHRLVAQYFIPNPENHPQVNHKDCDKSNNVVENLEWISRKENINHAHLMGRMKKRTDNTKIDVLSVEAVIELYTSVIRDGIGISEKARQMNIPRTTASSIMNKRSRETITNRLDSYIITNNVSLGVFPTIIELGFTKDSQLMRVPKKVIKTSASGITGVYLVKVEGIFYWSAKWGVKDSKTKYFNVDKFGTEEAFKMACEYREEKLIEINGKDFC